MNCRRVILVVVTLCSAANLSTAENDANSLWRRLWSDTDPNAQAKLAPELLAAIHHDVPALRKLIAADTAYADIKPGWHRKQLYSTHDARTDKTYEVEFHLRHHGRGYYLQAIELSRKPLDFSKRLRIPIHVRGGRKPDAWDIIRQQRAWLAKRMFSMSSKLSRKSNTLAIRGTGVAAVRIEVLEGMFKAGKPVTVTFGQARYRGVIPASSACMLEHYLRNRDGQRLVLNEVELSLGRGAKLGYLE